MSRDQKDSKVHSWVYAITELDISELQYKTSLLPKTDPTIIRLLVNIASPLPNSKQIREFCDYIKDTPRIRTLDLQAEVHDSEFFKEFYSGLQHNPHLRRLNISPHYAYHPELIKLLPTLTFLEKLSIKPAYVLDKSTISDSLAKTIAAAFFHRRNVGDLEFNDQSGLTDEIIDYAIKCPDSMGISFKQCSGLSKQALQRLEWHNQQKNLEIGQESPVKIIQIMPKDIHLLASKIFTETYTVTQSRGTTFTNIPNPRLAWSQILKPKESKIYECDDKEVKVERKPHLFCDWSIRIGDFQLLQLLKQYYPHLVKFWSGNPFALDNNDSEQYQPAARQIVETLLSQARPEDADRYQINDHKLLWQRIKNELKRADFSELSSGAIIPKHHTENAPLIYLLYNNDNEDEICPYRYPSMTDADLAVIAPLWDKNITKLNFYSCRFLSPNAILNAVSHFPQLIDLGLRRTTAFSAKQITTLATLCPALETLSVEVDTTKALTALLEFKKLKSLILRISSVQLTTFEFLSGRLGSCLSTLVVEDCSMLAHLDYLESCKKIREFYFWNLCADHLTALFNYLGSQSNLDYIYLGNCFVKQTLSAEQIQSWERQLSTSVSQRDVGLFFSWTHDTAGYLKINNSAKGRADISTLVNLLKSPPHPVEIKPYVNTTKLETKASLPKVRHARTEDNSSEALSIQPDYEPISMHYQIKLQFFLSDSSSPDYRMDRQKIWARFKLLNKKLELAPLSPEERQIKVVTEEIKIVKSINPQLLQELESKDHSGKKYYGSIALKYTLYKTTWTRVISHYLFPQPVTCTHNLVWGICSRTNELFARLPDKCRSFSQQLEIQYAAPVIEDAPERVFIAEEEQLPPIAQAIFEVLIEPNFKELAKTPSDEKIHPDLLNYRAELQKCDEKLVQARDSIHKEFPHFPDFAREMSLYRHNGKLRYSVIQQYCAFGHNKGFSAGFPKKVPSIHRFFDSLPPFLTSRLDRESFIGILDIILQRLGKCLDAGIALKWLCDYYKQKCHLSYNISHVFSEVSIENRMLRDDLGGAIGPHSYIKIEHCLPAPTPSAKEKHPAPDEKKYSPDDPHATLKIEHQYPTVAESNALLQPNASQPVSESTSLSSILSFFGVSTASEPESKSVTINASLQPVQTGKLSAQPAQREKNAPQLVQSAQLSVTEFKPVLPPGHNELFKDYWRLVLSSEWPALIYLPEEDEDGRQLMTSAKLYAQQPDNPFAPERLLPIEIPDLLDDWMEGHRITDKATEYGPAFGRLGHVLTNEQLSVAVINLRYFTDDDFVDVQATGDLDRILKKLRLSKMAHLLFLMPRSLLSNSRNKQIVLTRFTEFMYRPDLYAEAKPIRYLQPAPPDLKHSLERNLYANPHNATRELLGGLSIENGKVIFVDDGVLTQGLAQHTPVKLTRAPKEIDSLLFAMHLSGRNMVNGELRSCDGLTIYASPPENKTFSLPEVKELPKDVRQFCLNQYYWSYWVEGVNGINPNRSFRTTPPLLLSKDLTGIVVITQQLKDRQRFEDVYRKRDPGHPPLSFYFSKPSVSPRQFHNRIIESNNPSATIALLMQEEGVKPEDILTLTPEMSTDLLSRPERDAKGQWRNIDGWLLSRLREKTRTVCVGPMHAKELSGALEPLFTEYPYVGANGQLETDLRGQLIWIKPESFKMDLPETVSYEKHNTNSLRLDTAPKPAHPVSYRENLTQLTTWMESKHKFIELLGPPGAGKTTSPRVSVDALRKLGRHIQLFSTVTDYAEWRIQNPEDTAMITLLQLDDCRLWADGQLDFLHNINRRNQIYWNGRMILAPSKVILTNNLESITESHSVLRELEIPTISFNALTPAELKSEILFPALQEMKLVGTELDQAAGIILEAYQYIEKLLPYACISIRDLVAICRDLAVGCKGAPTMTQLARACYARFFGLFSEKSEPNLEQARQQFWQHLVQTAHLPQNTTAMQHDQSLHEKLLAEGRHLTEQNRIVATLVQRVLQTRGALLLQGPPGILKTETTLSVLIAEGYTPAPEDDAKAQPGSRHFINLTSSDPQVLTQQLKRAEKHKWVVVWNESNCMTESVENVLLKFLENPENCLIATQNDQRGRTLSRRLRNRFQIMHLRDYALQDLIDFAQKAGFTREKNLIASMFQVLRDYQQENRSPVANSRVYFRLLKELGKVKAPQFHDILTALFKTCCHPWALPDEQIKIKAFIAAQVKLPPSPLLASPFTLLSSSSTSSSPAVTGMGYGH